MELHFRLNDEVDAIGRPADDTWERFVIWNPDSLSPVTDERNEFAGDEKLIVVDDSFLSTDPFRISWGWWWWRCGSGGSRWIGVGW